MLRYSTGIRLASTLWSHIVILDFFSPFAGLAGADERASATTEALCQHGPCDPNHGGDSNATARHAGGTTRGELGCRVVGFPSLKKCNKMFKRTEDRSSKQESPIYLLKSVGRHLLPKRYHISINFNKLTSIRRLCWAHVMCCYPDAGLSVEISDVSAREYQQ